MKEASLLFQKHWKWVAVKWQHQVWKAIVTDGCLNESTITKSSYWTMSRNFWGKVENGGCFTHLFWTNYQFLCNYLLKYKLTRVVFWKLQPEFDNCFALILENFTQTQKYFTQVSHDNVTNSTCALRRSSMARNPPTGNLKSIVAKGVKISTDQFFPQKN